MKSFKTLITKAFSFIILIILLDLFAGYFFDYLEKKAMNNNPQGMTAEYSMWKVESDIIIAGASEVHHSLIPSLMKEKLGMSVYNCANDGQSFYYQYCMINSIIERKKPKMIIWSMSPYYLTSLTEKEKNSFSILNPFYDSNSYCKRVINMKSEFENLKMLSNLYRYNSSIFSLLINSFSKTNSDDGYLALNDSGYKYPTLITRVLPKCKMDMEIKNAFIEVINKCKKSNIQLILIFAPRYEIDDYSKNDCYTDLVKIANKYNVPLIGEYYSSPIFLRDSTLFKDHAHLNDKGARLFTALLCEKIKQR
jgi:hypothetical protein